MPLGRERRNDRGVIDHKVVRNAAVVGGAAVAVHGHRRRDDRRDDRRDTQDERRSGRDRRDSGREGGRDDRGDSGSKVTGLGDHVPDFILRSFKIEAAGKDDAEDEAPAAAAGSEA